MQAPKILPWVARKAGISEGDALDAWRRALVDAAAYVGVRSGATFDRVAVDRFVALAHARATVLSARAARPAPSVTRRWPPGAVAQRCAA
ncbi:MULTISPECIES: hypothetical protein [Thauera]|jgi:hypothetical protein|uniref:Uncharacterized protein n=1 Tax=Thauera aminoaromatica TaxID=164330 RepID=A0A5C7S9X5_THASP|nr:MULTISPECIES: hypothetical protein [Thauera]MDA0236322.1 hypothetical protein [Pseudomonadota bacterium]HMX12010.1 hypothetical protein [Burkholderiaceae bacterium]KIN92278.1 hypothetical protein PO78_4092 [Thauera sp. SWB20]MBP6130544.1 hypothetical protein [Thauera sp.]MBP7048524.1 hypothetical protein [Thauera sp.]